MGEKYLLVYNIKIIPFLKRKFVILLIKILIIIVLSRLLFKIFFILKQYKFCYEFIEKRKFLYSKCRYCTNEIMFRKLYIVSKENTLNEIIKYNKSISRFGDGEFKLIFGSGIHFQKYDYNLSKRLFEILNTNEKKLLIGIFFPFQKKKINTFMNSTAKFWKKWIYNYRFRMFNILKKKKYYSADISRFYIPLKDKSKVNSYIQKLKKIWEGRDVLIIEGEKTRVGIGNDLLNNTKSIKRILCPNGNAYIIYDKILKSALKTDKNNLILIALGPTASILAYDLTKFGYQAIDIGHADIQYELYLRNATRHIPISYKIVNEYKKEINEAYVGKSPDMVYYEQIIDKILNISSN